MAGIFVSVIVDPAEGETLAEKQAEALKAWEREHGRPAPANVNWLVREIVDPTHAKP